MVDKNVRLEEQNKEKTRETAQKKKEKKIIRKRRNSGEQSVIAREHMAEVVPSVGHAPPPRFMGFDRIAAQSLKRGRMLCAR